MKLKELGGYKMIICNENEHGEIVYDNTKFKECTACIRIKELLSDIRDLRDEILDNTIY